MPYRKHNFYHASPKPSNRLSAIFLGLKRIFYVPVASLWIISVITLALFFATISYMLWQNGRLLHDQWNTKVKISVYLKKKVKEKSITELVEKLLKSPEVSAATHIPPEKGIKKFKESTAFNPLLSSFKENPLPHVIIIQPQIKILSKDKTTELIKNLKSFPEVESIQIDSNWIERSHNLLNLWDKMSLILVFIFYINALLVIGGTSYIMAKIFAMKNDAPKIVLSYQLAWYNLISGLLVILLVRSIIAALQNKYIFLPDINIDYGIFLIIGSVLLSFISSRIATKR